MRPRIEDTESVFAPVENQHAALSPRRTNAQLLEFKCVEFVEELMYGQLRKKPRSELGNERATPDALPYGRASPLTAMKYLHDRRLG